MIFLQSICVFIAYIFFIPNINTYICVRSIRVFVSKLIQKCGLPISFSCINTFMPEKRLNNREIYVDSSNNAYYNNNKNEITTVKNKNILVYSSFFFISNAITAFTKEYYLYSFLFSCLTVSSIIVHSNDNIYTNAIDKIAILAIVLYGGYMLYNKINIDKYVGCSIIIITFVFCIYVYIYGFFTKKYCFCDENHIAQRYHFIMHIISSIGHHCIIFL